MENKNINLELFCITDKRVNFLESSSYKLGWVGRGEPPENYLRCDNGVNIFSKEKHYSELTFQYWYWKNKLDLNNKNWVGFCQKRRFWIKNSQNKINMNKDISEIILNHPAEEWKNKEAIICEPIKINKIKKMKMIKRAFKSLIKNPSPFFNENKRTIKFHFDMHHGYGNLDKAIDILSKNERSDFREYVNENCSFNPHIMFITKSPIMNRWYEDLFEWLFECEKIFGFKGLKGYDTTRLYAYLAERYLSFWFKKNTKYLQWPWTFFDFENYKT